jgi:hypothetical protein
MKKEIANYFQRVFSCSTAYIIASIAKAATGPAEYATVVHPHEAALYITIMVFIIGPALLALTDTIIDFVREKL